MTQTEIAQTNGTINVAGDSDWFRVSLTAGNEYVFNISAGSLLGNSSLALYDSSGNAVSTVASGAQLIFEPSANGTYFVGVSGVGNATGSFTVVENTAPFDYANTTATTGTLAIGTPASGTLSTAGQDDWFKVSLTAGSGYQFTLSGSALAAGQVEIYDSTGKLITTGNDHDTAAGNALFYVPTASGTYYVGVSDTQSNVGAFTLTETTATFDVAGNINTAGTVAVGGSVTGTLANVGQRDWYKVTLTAGTEYVFTNSSTSFITSVSLYDANGNALVTGYGGAANGSVTSYEPTVSGTYYVAAGSVLSTLGGFTLSVGTASPDVLGTTATTGTIAVGGSASGTIATPSQNDWYKVTLTAGNAYALTAGSGTLSGTITTFYDANGNAVASGSGATLFEPTTTGTYFVGAAGAGSNTGTYSLGLSSVSVDYAGTTATTGTIAVGGTATGTLAYAGQSDWFAVTLTAGTNYSASATGALAGAEVSFYDSSGNLVATHDSSGGTITPTTTGTYYVGVSSTSNASGAFTLALSTYNRGYADNTNTAGSFGGTLTAAKAIQENSAGTLTAGSVVADSAANVQANLDSLQPLASSGKISQIVLSDTTEPTITVSATQIATDTKVLQEISSPFTLKITGSSTALATFVQDENFAFIPGATHSGSDQVTEISSVAAGASTLALGSGFNAVIIDGVHSTTASTSGSDSFSFNVQANGTITLLDNNTGHTQTVTGASYLIFDGAATNSDGSFQSIYYNEGSTNAQITSLYNAAFLRQPDLGGLEFYAKPIAAGTFDLHQAAVFFLASPEFNSDYPTASLPSDDGGPNDQAFVTTLYNNVLHRAPDASGLQFYVHALTSGAYDRAALLEFFALSPENQANISDFVVNNTNGAYADSSALLSASTVLGQVSSTAALNLAAVSPTSIGTGVTANGITIAASDAVTLSSTAPTETVYLSSTFSSITVKNSGDTINDAAGGSTITLTGASNTTLTLTNGAGSDVVNLTGGTATTVNGFTAGSGTILHITSATSSANISLLDGSTNKVTGSSLTFGGSTAYVVEVGTVSDNTAATAATAINKAYTATGAANETVTFLAQDASGNTQVWAWSGVGSATDHQVDAGELVHLVTIAGVAPSTLTASDFG